MVKARPGVLRLARSHDQVFRDVHYEAVVARGDGSQPVVNAEAAPGQTYAPGQGIPLPPAVPTQSTDVPTATATGDAVSLPAGLSTVIPVAAAIVGVLLIAFLAWHFWYRRRARIEKSNRRNTWHVASKYHSSSSKEARSLEPSKSKSESSTTGTTQYPPRKVSAAPRTAGRRAAPASSPLRNQTDLDTKPKPKPAADANAKSISSAAPAAPSSAVIPTSPVSPGPTPNEETKFNLSAAGDAVSPPPVAAQQQLSFLRDVNKLPSFREPQRIQPVKRSASLLSSRMSVRRKPTRQATLPTLTEAKSDETEAPAVPSLRITDTDSPLEDGESTSHPLDGKLVTATDPYDATMPDELSIVVGETLRVIEAYDDDWCLAERVGRKKGRGIIPQMCIVEKGGVRPNMRFSAYKREMS